ncbi:MAG: SMC-Scp complex subunit ScpB [Candidatus Jacksonbacteria bacterium RIFOXYC2_FULL_44_29]|nr:MAG: Segregation and condensation protein B [Parcubacteria group bacterium GW2011_GWA2_42_28]KKT53785.1 MAG: Segregation and condensation protein B [Parcubacteria group bacterium GW2011_GWC2_44_22]OGY76682.1 MAG: SMC-Scp complex subunit ScpB [Candidatus Jacksonbacteria bacterium RIFOXYA2_FULL_43_12]OGY80569.1 MAG: SMC-Scp complex subunit ScpB [Candidatus Jacksonbacteria bacterium RIFOXYC2_FULL_44_29]HBH46012.1 SMC-Scp complex subunit ScpB [Candidatus Jacksonbacteria bacterium]
MSPSTSLSSLLESLLFSAGRALTYKELAKITKSDEPTIRQEIEQLQNDYKNFERGVRLTTNNSHVELTTTPENFSLVQELIAFERESLTQAQLETLTILAYNGPLTKAELEDIRGVNCSQILKNLKISDLIDEATHERLARYQVSTKFLKALGLTRPQELPDYQAFHDKKIESILTV